MKKLIIVWLFLMVFFLTKTGNVFAASLEFRPSSVNQNPGEKFKVDLFLNVGAGENVWGYDAYIKFPNTILSYHPADFVAGSVFTTGGKTVSSVSGSFISVGGYYDTTTQGTTAGGLVASLYFSGSSAGVGAIEIVCNQFTNIYSSGASQLSLFSNCSSLLPKTDFVISGSQSVTSTPTQIPSPTSTIVPGALTSTPAPTATRTPTSVPASGVSSPTPTLISGSSSSSSSSTGATSGQLTELPQTGMFDQLLRFIFLGIATLIFGVVLSFGLTRIGSRSPRIK